MILISAGSSGIFIKWIFIARFCFYSWQPFASALYRYNLISPSKTTSVARHKDSILLLIPENLQISAKQFYGHRLIFYHIPIQNGCHCHRTCTGSAGKCLTGSAFPYTHLNSMIVQYSGKFCVDTIRKTRMRLKKYPIFSISRPFTSSI